MAGSAHSCFHGSMLHFSGNDFFVMAVKAESRRISHEGEHRLFFLVGIHVAGGATHRNGGMLYFPRSQFFVTGQAGLFFSRYQGRGQADDTQCNENEV